MIAKLIRVEGDVQGVSFRYFAKKKAQEFKLSGWAKNEHNGTVSVVVQGGEEEVEKFVEWVKEGSPMSTVKNVKIQKVETEQLKGFEIR